MSIIRCPPYRTVTTIRAALAADAQEVGAVFDAAVSEGWKYLGDLVRQPMFRAGEWDKLVTEHAPPTRPPMKALVILAAIVGAMTRPAQFVISHLTSR